MMTKYERDRNIWFEFGIHDDGKVDIADSEDSTICTVLNKEQADKVIKKHNDLVYRIYDNSNDTP